MTHVDATAIRLARRQRVSMIRRRVVAGALALFVALWLLITLILVTGHDPALAKQTATTAKTTVTTSGSTTTPKTTKRSTTTHKSAATSSTTSSSTGSGASSSTGSSGSVSSLSTSQS